MICRVLCTKGHPIVCLACARCCRYGHFINNLTEAMKADDYATWMAFFSLGR